MTAEGVRVLGMGNLLHGDDGAGVCAARYLADGFAFDPPVEVLDGAVLGFGVLDIFDGGGPVLVLDGLVTDDPPGRVYRLPAADLLELAPGMRLAAHEVEPVELLRLHTALGDAPPTVLVGIATGRPRYGVGLSPGVRAGFGPFVAAALQQVHAWGVRARPTELGPPCPDCVLAALTRGPADRGPADRAPAPPMPAPRRRAR